MARRASFGRLPRVQPSLTGTLIAIAREMQNQRDQNIMDAWKNGGTFEGKIPTDETVLAYWKARMKNLDPGDPMYNAYQNQVSQMTYGIEQSKADLAHVQGKMSDTQYAQFFLRWAGKVPRNTEWWRTLQKDAAQLMESAKAKAKAAADKAKVEAFNAYVKGREGDVNLGNAMTEALQKISKETGLSITGNGEQLLSLLTQDFATHPDEYRLLADSLRGTSFSGTFTSTFVAGSIDSARQAYKEIATRANRDGYASAYSSAAKGQGDMTDWGQNLDVWGAAKSYDAAYDDFATVWNNPNASWADQQAAAAKFASTVTNVANTPGLETGTKTMMLADAARAMGQDGGDTPSFGQAMLGHTGFTPEMQQKVAFYTAADQIMQQNPGAYVYAPVTKDGSFDPTGQGAVGIVPVGSVPPDAVSVAVPGLAGSAKIVKIQPVAITVIDPNDPSAPPTTIGYALKYNSAGQQVTLYNYADNTGQSRWRYTSPIADTASVTTDKNGNLVVTPAGYGSPLDRARAYDAQNPGSTLGAQMAEQLSKVKDSNGNPVLPAGATVTADVRDPVTGQVTGTQTMTWNGTGFSVTQKSIIYENGKQIETGSTTIPFSVNDPATIKGAALSGSALTGGDIPGVTFDSAAAASIAVSSTNMTSSQVSALSKDPNFQYAFMVQTMASLGTDNPLDARVVKAWDDVTQKANTGAGYASPIASSGARYGKVGLEYPGQPEADKTSRSAVEINFGGQTLKIPGLPSYMKTAQAGGVVTPDSLKSGSDFMKSILPYVPFVGPPAPATTVTQPGATPGFNPTVTKVPSVTTTSTPPPQSNFILDALTTSTPPPSKYTKTYTGKTVPL
jgi:hypothetical protein